MPRLDAYIACALAAAGSGSCQIARDEGVYLRGERLVLLKGEDLRSTLVGSMLVDPMVTSTNGDSFKSDGSVVMMGDRASFNKSTYTIDKSTVCIKSYFGGTPLCFRLYKGNAGNFYRRFAPDFKDTYPIVIRR